MKELKLPHGEKALAMIRKFSATEKVIFGVFCVILAWTALSMLWTVNSIFLIPIPSQGGQLSEGVIGTPRFVNPLLAQSDTERDITSLVYAGLMKYENGNLVGDLAENYTVSEDGLTYTFNIRSNARFHDGEPVTADDVEFTVLKAQDATLKSPKRADWTDITIKKTGQEQIQFILKQPYAAFIENTTLGILPVHIWKNVDSTQFQFSQYNTQPIGAGQYKIASLERDSGGLPRAYVLEASSRYQGGTPYISKLIVRFFSNEKDLISAYYEGLVESVSSISPKEARRLATSTPDINILRSPLPHVIGVFFNQNQAVVLSHKEVRQALDAAIPRERIVKEVLAGYGVPITSPLPISVVGKVGSDTPAPNEDDQIAAARAILEKAGWKPNETGIMERKNAKKETETLTFSITTANSSDLKDAAEIIKNTWRKIGADVTVRIFENGDLSQNVIRPRKYDALLFGEVVGRDLDLFAFWHSSQRNSPGLNIAMYVNSTADKLLEDARATSDKEAQLDKYQYFEQIVSDDVPAAFVYSPDFIYIVPKKVQGINLKNMTTPADRWNGMHTWYINTDNVWKLRMFTQFTN